jgi:acetoin utilization protein AcuC
MTCTLHVAWDDRLTGYDFGPGHPMAPLRLTLTMELARAFGPDPHHGDPADPVDRAVLAARKAVFPHHGLMP